MKDVKITVVRKVEYADLMAMYENPSEHACDVKAGDVFVSKGGEMPSGMCQSAWDSMKEFVKELQKKNVLPFRYSQMGRWTGKTTVRDKDAINDSPPDKVLTLRSVPL